MDEYESRGSKFMDLEQNSGIRCGVVEGQLVSLWQYFGCFWRRQQSHSVEGEPQGGMGAGQGGDGVIVESQALAKIQQIQQSRRSDPLQARLLLTKSRGGFSSTT